MVATTLFSRAAVLLAIVFVGAGCRGEATSRPIRVSLGGGEALSYPRRGPSSCPSDYPVRRVVGQGVVCAEERVDFGAVTRAECVMGGVDCDGLHGCVAKHLSRCDATSTTADCGGSGPPVFACRSATGCMWFTHGCLAIGYDPSLCPVDDICCHPADGGGTSAFATSFELAGSASDFIDDYGTGYIELDDHFVLDVTEAEPPGFTSPSITCPSSEAHPVLCGNTTWNPVSNAAQTTPWFVGRRDLGAYGFTIEQRRLADGRTRGRVCLYSHTDEKIAACPATPPATPRCATAGTLTLGATGGRAAFTFQSGTWVVDFLR